MMRGGGGPFVVLHTEEGDYFVIPAEKSDDYWTGEFDPYSSEEAWPLNGALSRLKFFEWEIR